MSSDHQTAMNAARSARQQLMQAMAVREGRVSSLIGPYLFEDAYHQLTADSFVFSTPRGVRMHYALGQGVTMECPDASLQDECKLYLWGTVFGVVARLNGMMPFHASAVSGKHGAIAFSAPSGGGKSTLAMAMAAGGYPHICDDTLVIFDGPGIPMAIPDGKAAKLWSDSLELSGAEPVDEIGLMPGKFYASPPALAVEPEPLRDMIFLEWGDELKIERVSGSAKLEMIAAATYRGYIHSALGDRAFHQRTMLAMAQNVRVWKLQRPNELDSLTRSIDLIEEALGLPYLPGA